MGLIVQKFGGSSVANAEKVFNVASRVIDAYNEGNKVVVVVSAQGDTTDDLIEKAKEINPSPSKREIESGKAFAKTETDSPPQTETSASRFSATGCAFSFLKYSS